MIVKPIVLGALTFSTAEGLTILSGILHGTGMAFLGVELKVIKIDIEKVPRHGRGRPAKGKPRKVLRYDYMLATTIAEAPEKVDPLREQAGCFVLLSNLLDQPEA